MNDLKSSFISDTQRKVNALMGISDEAFKKYSGIDSETNKQRLDSSPNQMMFNCVKIPIIEHLQQSVNKMLGVDDATFKKYNK